MFGVNLFKICGLKITRKAWYWRTNALFVRSVLLDATPDNLLLIPIYRPNVLDNELVAESPCIWRYYLRDLKRLPRWARTHGSKRT